MSDRTLALAMDTSAEGVVAVASLGAEKTWQLVAERRLSARSFSSELLPAVEQVLAEAKATLHQLASLICVVGPGSFTGLRIGISTAKAFAEAASVPVLAVSSLAVLAAAGDGGSVPVISAGRGQWYVCVRGVGEWVASEEELRMLGGEHELIAVDELPADLQVRRMDRSSLHLFRAALPRLLSGAFDDVSTLDANYVRRAYMERADAPPKA